jgi:hypothetical protein
METSTQKMQCFFSSSTVLQRSVSVLRTEMISETNVMSIFTVALMLVLIPTSHNDVKTLSVWLYYVLSRVWVTVDGVWGFVTWFTDHLQIVTTSSSVANPYTLQITTSHAKFSQSVFTSRFLVTDPNIALYLRPYRLANISQLTHCFNWLIPRLAAISY